MHRLSEDGQNLRGCVEGCTGRQLRSLEGRHVPVELSTVSRRIQIKLVEKQVAFLLAVTSCVKKIQFLLDIYSGVK